MAAEELSVSEMRSPHILVVDDDPQIRELLEEYLTANELRISTAVNGERMEALLASETIDLIVLDLRLAGEDGMTIARKLRRQLLDSHRDAHRRAG